MLHISQIRTHMYLFIVFCTARFNTLTFVLKVLTFLVKMSLGCNISCYYFSPTIVLLLHYFGLGTYSKHPFSAGPFSADFTLVRFVKESKIIHLVRFLLYKFHFSAGLF